MQDKSIVAENPNAWLQRANSDLIIASRYAEDIFLEDLCFHAQQAVEKALKAVLIAQSVKFPYTHNIGVLLGLIENRLPLPSFALDAAELTSYSVATRYPGADEVVEYNEWCETIQVAKVVVAWATEIVTELQKMKAE
ncbi:MAG: HEPN domain-containing protein [Bacteroidia bacterium]|nr:HEPN domain-containing protein [Bacteroidia bacterium]